MRLASIVMFLGVALGAFGAHALAPTLELNDTRQIWITATQYHLIHGLALWIPQSKQGRALPYWFFLSGIIIFSGSLYLLALTNTSWLGAITPIGGALFLAGWATLAFSKNEA